MKTQGMMTGVKETWDSPEIHSEIVNQRGAKVAADTSAAVFDALETDLIPASVSERGYESAIEIDNGMKEIFGEADTIRDKYREQTKDLKVPVDRELWVAAGAISAVFYKYSPGNKVNMEERLKEFDDNNRVKASEMVKKGLAVCADKSACVDYLHNPPHMNAQIMVTDMRSSSSNSREKHAAVIVHINGEDFIVDPNNPISLEDNNVLPGLVRVPADIASCVRNNQPYDTGDLINVATDKQVLRYAST